MSGMNTPDHEAPEETAEPMDPERAQALLDAAAPQPWSWGDALLGSRLAYSLLDGNRRIIVNADAGKDVWPSRDDAALIAAAPALAAAYLRACEELRQGWPKLAHDANRSAIEQWNRADALQVERDQARAELAAAKARIDALEQSLDQAARS